LHGFKGFDKAVRGVEGIVGALAAVFCEQSVKSSLQFVIKTYGKSSHALRRHIK
jgi:hypothetical protein